MKRSSLWKLLKSMKFAIWILIILAATSLVSMFIIEFYPLDTRLEGWQTVYRERYGWFFYLIKYLHLQDPYRSWWYQILLGILTLSLVLCALDRLPKNLKLTFRSGAFASAAELRNYPHNASFTGDRRLFDRLKSALSGYSMKRKEQEDEVFLVADRGRWSYLGASLIHIGLLALLLGGFLAIWGDSTFGEGAPGDIIQSDKFHFQVRVDDFRIEYYPLGVGQWVLADDRIMGKIVKKLSPNKFRLQFFTRQGNFTQDLDASLIKNKFDINSDKGNIKDYISDLTILEDGREVLTRRVEVNKPLRYQGFRFYQNSFNTQSPLVKTSADSAILQISRISDQAILDTIAIPLEGTAPLPDGISLKVTDFLPDFRIVEGKPLSASDQMQNPAVKLEISRKETILYRQWLFLYHEFHSRPEEARFDFRLLDIVNPRAEAKYRTILQIKKNHGYSVIWAGFIVGTLGLILSFYFAPRHLKLALKTKGDTVEMAMGGYSPQNKERFSQEFKRIAGILKGNN